MAIMAMVHVPSLVMTKSFVAYQHQFRKMIIRVGGGLVRTQSLKMVMKKQVGGMQQFNGIMCAIRDVFLECTNYSIVVVLPSPLSELLCPLFFLKKTCKPKC
jgi:hypothetical protein